MARITLGMATAHGPQITLPSDTWNLRVEADRQNRDLWYRGRKHNYEELVALRKTEGFAQKISSVSKQDYFDRCQKAVRELSDVYERSGPDIALIVGNDQLEIFTEVNIPALAVYWGETVANIPKTQEMIAKLPAGIAPAEVSYCPPERVDYPGQPELARHLIEAAIAENFDVAQMRQFPTGPRGSNSVPHAYGFIYRTIMKDKVPPNVPVIINTHYPPNRPSVARCIDFGKTLARAVKDWAPSSTVSFIASGGMTHYAIDEEFDRSILHAMSRGDEDALSGIDESMFNSGGTAELKSWMTVFGAMQEAGAKMRLVDYVPCYRSEAGTGNAMGFVYWET